MSGCRFFSLSLVCALPLSSLVLINDTSPTDNVIREALKQRLVALPVQETSFLPESHPSARPRKSDTIIRLHMKANAKCHAVVRHVVNILRRNLGTPFFHYDAALVRDGCFFAGFLLAGENRTPEDVDVCLAALSELRWAFSKATSGSGRYASSGTPVLRSPPASHRGASRRVHRTRQFAVRECSRAVTSGMR